MVPRSCHGRSVGNILEGVTSTSRASSVDANDPARRQLLDAFQAGDPASEANDARLSFPNSPRLDPVHFYGSAENTSRLGSKPASPMLNALDHLPGTGMNLGSRPSSPKLDPVTFQAAGGDGKVASMDGSPRLDAVAMSPQSSARVVSRSCSPHLDPVASSPRSSAPCEKAP